MLGVPAIQVAHPLTARLPPEVQETVSNGVVLEHDVVHVSVFLVEEHSKKLNSCMSSDLGENTLDQAHTCLFSVIALGWHLVQIPSGQGGWPSQPDLILQLMFSRAANFPLQEVKAALESDKRIV